MTPFQLFDDQELPLSIAGTDAVGNPVGYVGPPVWSADSSGVVSITPSADGLSCVAITTGKLGLGTVTCTATLANGQSVSAAYQIQVSADAPASFVITPGTPIPRPLGTQNSGSAAS